MKRVNSALTAVLLLLCPAVDPAAWQAPASSLAKDPGPAPIAASPKDDLFHLYSYTHVIGECNSWSEIGVCWSSIGGSDGYSVLWSQDSLAEPDCFIDNPSWDVCSRRYTWEKGPWYFSVRSVSNLQGCGQPSRIGPFVFGDPAPAPQIVSPAWGDVSVSLYDSLCWDAVGAALAYCLYVDDDSDFTSPEVIDSQLTSCSFPLAQTGLLANTVY